MSRRAPHQTRHLSNLRQIEPHWHAVKSRKGHGHFAEIGIARALAHPVDCALNPFRPAAHCCHRASRRHPKIIVPVKMEREIHANPIPHLPNQELHGLRSARPDRIDHDQLFRACLQRTAIKLLQRFQFRARAVHCEKRDGATILSRVSDRFRRAPHRLVYTQAVRSQLDRARRCLNHRRMRTQPQQLVDVRLKRAPKSPNLCLQPGLRNQPKGLCILSRDSREPGFNPSDTQAVERPCDLKLLLRRQHYADALLPISERRVIKLHRAPQIKRLSHLRAAIQFADPYSVFSRVRTHRITLVYAAAIDFPLCFSLYETTGLRSTPIFSISHSTTSPGFRYKDFGWPLDPATPETVPVDSTSPAE